MGVVSTAGVNYDVRWTRGKGVDVVCPWLWRRI